ncbi:asparaginyl-tRNA synthetase [Rhizoctonia solani AG-1 IB]|uniref:asparagine--tRNA ligase n=2 Tax=Thanatephorus cucumeris (strain AG1-IB / isolate 7/3/14) TaxID=1108050 RepID=A0A0B7FP36_THACB|nr:asparaginyl-tRNA synthetase [Rhizoctonia solani AG-1 IB]
MLSWRGGHRVFAPKAVRWYSRPAAYVLPHTIKQLLASSPEAEIDATLTGFVRSIRKQKHVAFADISDGSTPFPLQAVIESDKFEPDIVHRITSGSNLKLTGKLVKSSGEGQEWDFNVAEMEVLGTCDPAAYPIQKKTHTHEHLRANAHLRPRTDETSAMLRTRALLNRSICDYFDSEQFIQVHPPIITSSDTEGAGETFRVNPASEPPELDSTGSDGSALEAKSEFFGAPAYLSVSAQLHLEALSHSLSRVYTLAPSFRAERSQTNRHLAEFWMLEAELQLSTPSLGPLLDVVEGLLRSVFDTYTKSTDAVVRFPESKAARHALETEWKRMTYTHALEELNHAHDQGVFIKPTGKGKGKDIVPRPVWGQGLRSEHERYLARDNPVFVTDYPADIKPFYMRLNDESSTPPTVACFDLLLPGLGELVGGSVREERLDHLDATLKQRGMDADELAWYRDLRLYGGGPHAGFGLGFERLVSFVTGLENVRECIAFPRAFGKMKV